jgi:hypothetical protein
MKTPPLLFFLLGASTLCSAPLPTVDLSGDVARQVIVAQGTAVSVLPLLPGLLLLSTIGIGGRPSTFFRVEPAGFEGPRIARVTPLQIVAGTRDVQIEVEGLNFRQDPPTDFGALRNETTGVVLRPALATESCRVRRERRTVWCSSPR